MRHNMGVQFTGAAFQINGKEKKLSSKPSLM